MTALAAVAPDRPALVQRGLRLETLTVVWNSAEAVIGIVAGVAASSIALVGFGLDSVIEVSSGAVLLWRLRADRDHIRREQAERLALRLVGVSFLALATYVAADAAFSLWRRQAPEESLVGIGLAIASLVAMPLLARAKRRVAAELGSAALHADSQQTQICAYLSVILLTGLALNAAFAWWWADPVAGLLMTPIIVSEGVEALRGRTCCDAASCG